MKSKIKFNLRGRRGITLLELILSLAIMAFLMGLTFLWLNPNNQMMNARNSERTSHLNSILVGIQNNKADNRNSWTCSAGPIPTSTEVMGSASGSYNIAPCLVPNYMPSLPVDPTVSGAHFSNISDYSTGYSIVQDASSGVVALSAPGAEGGVTISVR